MNAAYHQPLRPRLLTAVLVVAGLVVGCSGLSELTTGEQETSSGAETSPAPSSSMPPTSAAPPRAANLEGVGPCVAMTAAEMAPTASPLLTEVSGAAASQRYEGVVWVHNDNGASPALIALDLDGAVLGAFPLSGITGVDLEDLALVDGTLYLGDIGDNLSRRDGITVYRFAEPDPRAGQAIDQVEVLKFAYPDRAYDAEALLVDPVSGQLVIITKSVQIGGGDGSSLLSAAPAPVFVADPPFNPNAVTTLVQEGVVPLDQLQLVATGPAPDGSISQFGLTDVATGADIRADGSTIAIRTYRSVWLFARRPGQSVAEALNGTPCQAPTVFEVQGESIAFLHDQVLAFVTISEGTNPAINVTR